MNSETPCVSKTRTDEVRERTVRHPQREALEVVA